MITKHTNRLIHSTSPYLLQHAHNPVDWYEWSEDALMRARQEDKPILVSIGYSSCHWCHVMEREVFENEELASLMNEHLICIKVDREERPDVDQIYMDAVQAMGVHGGWPLNVFLTPEQKPFYGGTYFPPDQWKQVVNGIHKAYRERKGEVEESAQQFAEHLAQQDYSRFIDVPPGSPDIHADIAAIYGKLEPAFDRKWGGLDKAPKFIMPSIWLWLLRYHHITKNNDALKQITLTLRKIGMGGIYDQIGGGFARYSVDSYWFAPHFEKMLYDNAQLLSLYAEAYQATGDPEYRTVLDETFEWLVTEMMHAEGAFYSALDADSEGVEGKFYTWTTDELKKILGEHFGRIESYYSIRAEGNWEHGRNILFRQTPEQLFLANNSLRQGEWQTELRSIKDILLEKRDNRIPPSLDDKIITAWNAMAITGLMDCFKATSDEKFLKGAMKAMEFVERNLIDGTNVFRSYKGKRSQTHGFLDDYAFLIQAYLKVYQGTFNEYWAKRAEAFIIHTIDNFLDSTDGYFFYSSKYADKLIASKKEMFDNVIPASNSVMAQNLWHAGTLLDNSQWKEMARRMVLSLSNIIKSDPNYMSNWAIVYTEIMKGVAEVAFVGEDALTLKAEWDRRYEPFVVAMGSVTQSTLPLLLGKTLVEGKSTIYVCYDKACQKPVHEVNEAFKQLA